MVLPHVFGGFGGGKRRLRHRSAEANLLLVYDDPLGHYKLLLDGNLPRHLQTGRHNHRRRLGLAVPMCGIVYFHGFCTKEIGKESRQKEK